MKNALSNRQSNRQLDMFIHHFLFPNIAINVGNCTIRQLQNFVPIVVKKEINN
jgi:hypothetical protein